MRRTIWVIIAITCFANIALWSIFNQPESPEPSWSGTFNYVSFSPYRQDQDPVDNKFPSPEEIMEDLRFLKGKTRNPHLFFAGWHGAHSRNGHAIRL